MRAFRIIAVVILASFFLSANSAVLRAADEWASFRNGVQLLGVAKSELPSKPELLWEIDIEYGTAGAPAIVGDFVYAATIGGELVCVERKTGKRAWTYYSGPKPKPDAFVPAFKSSPTVTDTMVYLGDEDGVFHAVDRKTGKQAWNFPTGAEIVSSATIVGEKILFGSYDNSLYCLNLKDGKKLWAYETDGYVNCTPAVSGGFTFVTGCDEHLRVINITTGEQEYAMPLETYLIASPAVVDNMLYVGTYASEVIGVDWKKQSVEWRYRDPKREFPYHASAAVTDQLIVVGGRDKQLHCIERETGKGRWTFPTRSRIDGSAVIAGGKVYFGSGDKNLYAVDLATGKETWKYNVGDPVTGSPAIAAGCLVIGTEAGDGKLFCFGTK